MLRLYHALNSHNLIGAAWVTPNALLVSRAGVNITEQVVGVGE